MSWKYKTIYAYLTKRFVRVEQRFNFAFFIFEFAVLHCVLPVTCLLLDIKIQTCRASNCLEALGIIRFVSRRLSCVQSRVKAITQQSFYGHTDDVHWITSLQLSPSPATSRNHSPASLSLHSSVSKLSSFFEGSSCRFTLFTNWLRTPCLAEPATVRKIRQLLSGQWRVCKNT